ncbi:MAG: hypothetical protein Q8904_05210 [Bacteroidota bacterium]|nr:hypothetical protein [Bacteroidota bacterium]
MIKAMIKEWNPSIHKPMDGFDDFDGGKWIKLIDLIVCTLNI